MSLNQDFENSLSAVYVIAPKLFDRTPMKREPELVGSGHASSEWTSKVNHRAPTLT